MGVTVDLGADEELAARELACSIGHAVDYAATHEAIVDRFGEVAAIRIAEEAERIDAASWNDTSRE